MRHAFWLLSLLAMSGMPALAQAEKIDAYVRERMAKEHIPGLSIAVVRDGKIVYANGFGLANVEMNVPATKATVYWLMSVSKQFTAAAVLILAEEGKLDLDTPVGRYLDNAPDAWKDVKVRNLLTHTSGIADYTDEGIGIAPPRAAGMPAALVRQNTEHRAEQYRQSNECERQSKRKDIQGVGKGCN